MKAGFGPFLTSSSWGFVIESVRRRGRTVVRCSYIIITKALLSDDAKCTLFCKFLCCIFLLILVSFRIVFVGTLWAKRLGALGQDATLV